MLKRNPADNDEARQATPPDKGPDGQARPQILTIQKTGVATIFTGQGSGHAHDEAYSFFYAGASDDFAFINTRCGKEDGSRTTLSGQLTVIVENGILVGIRTMIHGTDGQDPHLPSTYREISLWKKVHPSP